MKQTNPVNLKMKKNFNLKKKTLIHLLWHLPFNNSDLKLFLVIYQKKIKIKN